MSLPHPPDSDHPRWSKRSIITGAITAVASLLLTAIGLYFSMTKSGVTANPPGNTFIVKEDKRVTQIISLPPSVSSPTLASSSAANSANKAAKSENLWDDRLSLRLKKIILGKAGYNPNGRISGSLILSNPEKIREDRLAYNLTLKIEFFTSSDIRSCGQLTYTKRIEAETGDSKERITRQGLEAFDGIFVQLERETDLPFCPGS